MESVLEQEDAGRPGLRIDVVTLFPEMFAPSIGLSIIGRAVEAKILTVSFHNPLDYLARSERADDTPYGGGAGMVMRLEPITRILDELLARDPGPRGRAIILTSPAGEVFGQPTARRFAALGQLIIVCGHYEGIDDRLAALYPLIEMNIGDFILTGGEIPALAMIDATVRLLEGAVRAESLADESFDRGLLDYPSYTRPPRFRGIDVPAVLLSGDHAAIAAWRREQSRERTRSRRPDLSGGR